MLGKRLPMVLIDIVAFLMASDLFRYLQAQEIENMAVTATVPANSSNFQVSLVQNTSGTRFPHDTQLQYTITYGSTLSANVNLTLVASWLPLN